MKITQFLFVALGASLSLSALAANPPSFKGCPQIRITKPADLSATTYFDETCSVLYVAPPSIGRVEVDYATPVSDLRDGCSKLDVLFERSRNELSKMMDSKSDKVAMERAYAQWQMTHGQISEILLTDGMTARLSYHSLYNETVEQYRTLNPSLRVQPLPITAWQVTASEVSAADFKAEQLPAVRKLTLESHQFSDGVGVNMILTKNGACPLLKPKERDSMKVYGVANTTYKFDVVGFDGKLQPQYGSTTFR